MNVTVVNQITHTVGHSLEMLHSYSVCDHSCILIRLSFQKCVSLVRERSQNATKSSRLQGTKAKLIPWRCVCVIVMMSLSCNHLTGGFCTAPWGLCILSCLCISKPQTVSCSPQNLMASLCSVLSYLSLIFAFIVWTTKFVVQYEHRMIIWFRIINSLCVQTHLAIKLFLILSLIFHFNTLCTPL